MKNTQFIFLKIKQLKAQLILILIITNINLFAQDFISVPSATEIQRFKTSKTYLVLENQLISEFNIEMPEAMERHWHMTDFETIKATKFLSLAKNKANSFIYLNPVVIEKDKVKTTYLYCYLSLGHPSGKTNQLTDIIGVPLATQETEAEHYSYKYGLVIKFMQHYITTLETLSAPSNNSIISHYTSQNIKLEDYELWLIKDEIDASLRNNAKFSTVYPYPFKFVNKNEIDAAIEENRKNTLVLHLIKAGKNQYCLKLIADTESGNLLFYDYHKTSKKAPSVLLEKDLKKLAK